MPRNCSGVGLARMASSCFAISGAQTGSLLYCAMLRRQYSMPDWW
jgi:hypothetical protein